jgi:hypothetical protein
MTGHGIDHIPPAAPSLHRAVVGTLAAGVNA